MSTITQKRKLSKSAWALVFIAIIAVVAVIILASLGVIDLTPASDAYLTVFMWASINIVNALLISVGFFVFGLLFYYVVITYFVGSKVKTTAPVYTPQGQTVAQQPTSGTETVIS